MKASDWEVLTDLLSEIEAHTIASVEVPSKSHQFDGAAITHLKILTSEDEIVSPAFDDNNPPSELKPVIDKLIGLATKMK